VFKLKTILYLALVAAVLTYVKVKFLTPEQTGGPPKPSANGKLADPPMTVGGILVKAVSVPMETSVNGSLLPGESVELHSEGSGRITQFSLEEGASVRAGQVLLRLFDGDLLAQKTKLEVQLKQWLAKEKRQQALIDVQGVSREEYEATLAQRQSIEADISLVNAQLSRLVVKAPFEGVIGLRNVSPGAYITPATALAVIYQTATLKLEFAVDESIASHLKIGQSVRYTLENDQQMRTAMIYAREFKADPDTRRVIFRAKCQTAANQIAGSFVKVALPLTSENSKSILIPTSSIIPILKGKKVFVVSNGLAEERKIETGIRNDSSIVVLKGLSEGDTLLTSGLMQLKPGAAVNVR
jgi:membrane fusion protein (multidrug efflux system)